VSSPKELVDGDARPLKSSVPKAKPPRWTSQITLCMESQWGDMVRVAGKLDCRTIVLSEVVASGGLSAVEAQWKRGFIDSDVGSRIGVAAENFPFVQSRRFLLLS